MLFCLQVRLMFEDYGKYLMSVEDLLQKYSLLEVDIYVLGERVKIVNILVMKFVDGDVVEVGGKNFFLIDFVKKEINMLLIYVG